MARAAAPLALAALLLAGCTGGAFVAAHVPEELVRGDAGNGWAFDASRSDAAPQSDGLGLTTRQSLVYLDDGQGGTGTYPASLSLITEKSTPSPSEAQLRDLVRERVRQRSEEQGIRLNESSTREGARDLASGHRTLFFVFTGTLTGEGPLFTTRDATAKIIGEVWNCPASGTSVIAVGLAQVSSVRSLGGIPVAVQQDSTNWRELSADPSGTIEGQRGGDGLLYNVRCVR